MSLAQLPRLLSCTALALACGWSASAVAADPAPTTPANVATTDASPRVFPVTPTRKPDGTRWRLGYLQGGDYGDYPIILSAIVRGMITLGWLEDLEIPDARITSSQDIWAFLATKAKSQYVEFVPDGYYSPGNFNAKLRPEVRDALTARLNDKRDLDMMIAMGTWAGQDLARAQITVPTIVASTSDPVAAGIIASTDDSGRDHVHAKVEPERYQRQVQLFHDIVPFKRLGIVYENSAEGRTFGGVDAVEQMATRLGFAIEACHAPFNNVTPAEAMQGAEACYAKVAAKADAVYLTVHRGVTSQSLGPIVDTLLKARLPSFSMLGSDEVRRGVLMSMAQADYSHVGLFHAEVMARIFHGAKPRELSQIWLSPAEIAINLKAAEIIGFDPPIDILLASDEVYDSVGDK
ncbi:hypothetical protein FXN63_19335 [Pigmentiphaga aceris]|uniref:ABC transporter substrate-binding protein n=2 Tax=Pigmentiphaga aceris TaxID=1940612 RepID=A0A5C0B3H2_9BURK|nr:hypothetical protein FXN63_19335 [Pigmentiphaga aceris]